MRLASRSRRPRLAIEPLEARDTPAGTVSAAVAGGVLTLTGDDLDNVVEVQQTRPGAFTVLGTNTTILGGPNFTGVNSVVANLADGNDTLTLTTTVDQDADGNNDFILPGALTVNAGDGNNTLSLSIGGKVQLAALSYAGGDGQDQVSVVAGLNRGSKVTGNVVVNVGVGINSQGPVSTYADTYVSLANLDIAGAGGLRMTGADGTEYVALGDLTVAGAVYADGGDGGLDVTTDSGTFGSLTVKSAGAGLGLTNLVTALTVNRTKVTGPVSVKGGTGTSLLLNGAELGPTTVAGGKAGLNGAGVEATDGASTVHGDLKLTGGRVAAYTDGGPTGAASLTVDRALTLTGAIVDINMAQGSSIAAGTLTVSGTHSAQFYSYNPDATTPGKLTVARAATFKGPSVDFSQYGGAVQVGGKLTLQATKKATFTSSVAGSGFLFNTPRAGTTAGSILVQGREVEFHQVESDVTAATGLSLVGKETALFDAFPRDQTEDPNNPGTYDPAVGATTTVTNGSMLMSAPESAEYYQADGVLTLSRGLTILAPAGSASYRTDVGREFNAPGPRLVIPAANMLIQGNSADFLFQGGVATVGGTVSVLSKEGARFETDYAETYDVNYDYTDLYPTVTTGTVTVNGGVDSANFSTYGETFTAHGDVTIKGAAGLSRIYFEDRTGSQVDGDVTITTGSDFDDFLAWGPLTVGGNLSVDLGAGANAFETGVRGGTTRVAGNVTFKSGGGSDAYSLARLEVTGSTAITTGAGYDQVYLLDGTKFTGPVTIDTGGGADLVSVATALPDPNDPVNPAFPAGAVEFDAKATINLGAGNDTLVLGDPSDPVGVVAFGPNGSIAADGGPSLGDKLTLVAGQVAPTHVVAVGFEL